MLYYREDLLKDAGLEVPKTWDDIVACATALTGEDEATGQMRYGLGQSFATESNDPQLLLNYIVDKQGSLFNEDGTANWANDTGVEAVNWTVDCVLTHCAPSGVVQKINPSYGTDELTDFLEMVSQRCKFAYWFFGHYHENRIIDQKYILQWEKISELSF